MNEKRHHKNATCLVKCRLLAPAIICCALIFAHSHNVHAQENNNNSDTISGSTKEIRMKAEELAELGQRLRTDIAHTYDDLAKRKEIRPNNGGYDVSLMVAKYIPVGTSFTDAAIILRSAGIELAPLPPRKPQPPTFGIEYDRFSIVGRRVLHQWPLATSWITITLTPERPGQFENTVRTVLGQMGVDSL